MRAHLISHICVCPLIPPSSVHHVCVCVCVCVCVGASPASSSEVLCSGWEWGHPEGQWLWPRDRPSPVHHQVLRGHTHTHTTTPTLSHTHTHTHSHTHTHTT